MRWDGFVAQENPLFDPPGAFVCRVKETSVFVETQRRAPGEFATKNVSNSPWLPKQPQARQTLTFKMPGLFPASLSCAGGRTQVHENI
jgi:hypothetical protein